MKVFGALIAVSAFIAIAVFGFLAMNHSGGHEGCIAASLAGGLCLPGNSLSLVDFHADAYRGFSRAVFSPFAFDGALIALAFLFFSILAFYLFKNLGNFFFTSGHRLFELLTGHRASPSRFIAWYSLHENSPNFS